ncbi:MAG: tetratricopeptide repeat protein [Verrucomicrobiales bacterium]
MDFFSLMKVAALAATIFSEEMPDFLEDPTLKRGVDIRRAEGADAAFQYFSKAAQAGDVAAVYALGVLYESGEGPPASVAEAERYYRAAANAGYARAQSKLGMLLLTKAGSPELGGEAKKDAQRKEGFEWLGRAAEGGSARAMRTLGKLYYTGVGLEKDDAAAWRWFRRAAAAEDAAAAYHVGLMIEGGRVPEGEAESAGEAKAWYLRAAAEGLGEAMLKLATLAKVEGAEADAVVWLEKAAAANHPLAAVQLSAMYYSGTGGVGKDIARAGALLESAAKMGYAPAYISLAKFYAKDDNDAARQMAAEWLGKGAARGSAECLVALGDFYLGDEGREGIGKGEPDYGKAAGPFLKAAAAGHPEAFYQLGRFYEHGLGTEANLKKAGAQYQFAAQRGHPDAQACLARFFAEGIGCEKDLVRAYAMSFNAKEASPLAKELADKLAGQLSPAQLAEAKAQVAKARNRE